MLNVDEQVTDICKEIIKELNVLKTSFNARVQVVNLHILYKINIHLYTVRS